MAKRQIILLLLMVCLPLAMLAWLGSWLARNEQEMVQQRFRELLTGRLEDTERVIAAYFQQRERELLKLTELDSLDADQLRQIVRRHPRIRQLFVLNTDGSLLHPDPAAAPNQVEREFLRQAREILLDKDLIRRTVSEEEEAAPAAHGWYVRYWGPGLQLIFYQRLSSGRVVGVLLQRSRWIADVIAELPATASGDGSAEGWASASRISLVDSNGRTVYQWGPFEPADRSRPVVELPLSDPLGSWRLKYFVDEARFTGVGRSAYFNLYSALALVGIGLIAVAVYFYREYAREMREAMQRVNFVNQVSHELKTPLTSIRMYAELLQRDLDADEVSPVQGHLEVIVAES